VLYVGGVTAIFVSLLRSAWWSWRAKLNEDAVNELDNDRNKLLM